MNAIAALEKNFTTIFIIESDEDLNKIHFCFKKKTPNEEFVDILKKNLVVYDDHSDISIIQGEYKKILSRIVDKADLVRKKDK